MTQPMPGLAQPMVNMMTPQMMQMQALPPAPLWPGGVGITDRDNPPDDCSCPPCFCCVRPIWFADRDGRLANKSEMKPAYCSCADAWYIPNADVLGVPLAFVGKQCGESTCYEPEVHVSEGGRPIGKAVMKMPCCACGETIMAEARDASGNPKFQRVENACCPQYRYWSGDRCGWQEYNWPIYGAQMGKAGGALTYITYKYHCCFAFHPIWVGVRNWPAGITADDQKLLLALALCRWWRAEQDQKRDQDANPVY